MLIKISFYNDDEMRNKNIYHGVESVPNSNRKKPRNRGKIDTSSYNTHGRRLLSWLDTSTSIKSGGGTISNGVIQA